MLVMPRNTELFERCLGGFSQNRNGSFNCKVWKVSRKTTFCGPNALEWGRTSNNIRITSADCRISLPTKEGRIEIRRERKAIENLNLSEEDVMYGPGID